MFDSFDLRAYLEHVNVPYWEAGSPNVARGWVGISCFYCGDSHNHLGVSLARGNFSCWKCRAKGGLLTLIQDLENVSYGDALRRVEEFQTLTPITPEERTRQAAGGDHLLPFGCGELTGGMRAYLQRRRYDPDELVASWGLMGGPISGDWHHRIIIPVRLSGQLVTWIGMDTSGHAAAKYKAAAVEESYVPTSELVYNADRAGQRVVVVEGTADAWRMGTSAVALLGMGTSVNKLAPLLALPSETFYVMLDGEPLAQQNAHAIAHNLVMHGRKAEVVELDSGDPDDLTDEQAAELRRDLMLEDA